jgi:DNA-3-methyladenine glycosylase II
MIDRMAEKACPPWADARRHLRAADPVLARLIDRVGPCTLAPRRDYFHAICQSIITQQISLRAAATVQRRFRDLFPRRRPTPAAAGLSPQKLRYIRGVAEASAAGQVPTRRLRQLSDEQVIEVLDALPGIGRWTAEMFLIFVLCRPDVLPVDDLSLCSAVQRAYGLRRRPDAARLIRLAEPWRPWRSVASWYLWRSADTNAMP